jgi:hypothetical protein
VLIDFWEYSCVNCIRTGPYVRTWWDRYATDGLIIIGVHTPEFEFGKQLENVQRAVKEEGIKYPVVLDNKYAIWQAYNNSYWPAQYLFDTRGNLRYTAFGEGKYDVTESNLQKLLKEAGVRGAFPAPLGPLIPSHREGAVCLPSTDETYVGYARALPGNPGGFTHDADHTYKFPATFEAGKVYLDGSWYDSNESASASGQGDEHPALGLQFTAAEVNLVMAPPLVGEGQAQLLLDGRPLTKQEAGADVQPGPHGESLVQVDEPRMYRLYGPGAPYGTHRLVIKALSQGLVVYVFTFGTECK